MNVIASAYGKDSNPEGFIQNSELLYLDPDKKRTNNWLNAVGLQLPSVASIHYGSIGSITYQDGKIKIVGVPYEQYMQNSANQSLKSSVTDGKMKTEKHSLSEDMENGRERKESREDFRRRCRHEGFNVFEGDTASYGYRTYKGVYQSRQRISGIIQEIQKEVKLLGFDADIIDGIVYWNRGSVTNVRKVSEAVTIEGKRILISKNSSISPKNTAGHEAFIT